MVLIIYLVSKRWDSRVNSTSQLAQKTLDALMDISLVSLIRAFAFLQIGVVFFRSETKAESRRSGCRTSLHLASIGNVDSWMKNGRA